MAHSIAISWTPSPPPISGYNIRRGTASGNEGSIPINVNLVTTSSYTDNTVVAGHIYSYAVSAVYNGVESLNSIDIVSQPVPFPASPQVIELGAAASFMVLAGSTVTNVPGTDTTCSGDVGVSPGTAITGFGARSILCAHAW